MSSPYERIITEEKKGDFRCRKFGYMNIADYIEAARRGNSEAIAVLYDEYKNNVYFLCLKLTGEEEEAESVLQYTFFQAFHKLNVLKNPDNFAVWLNVIAANRCRIVMKEKNPVRFMQNDDKVKKVRLKYGNIPKPTELYADAQVRDELSRIIDSLPDQLRFAAMMYYYSLANLTQIGKVLECDENSVRYYISRASEQLETELTIAEKRCPALGTLEVDGELYTVLHGCEYDVEVPENISEETVATSVTLAMSAASTYASAQSNVREEPEPEIEPQGDIDENNSVEPIDSRSYDEAKIDSQYDPNAQENTYQENDYQKEPVDEQNEGSVQPEIVIPNKERSRTAIRNILTVIIVLILSVSIVAASVSVIKNAAKTAMNDLDGIYTGEKENIGSDDAVIGNEGESESSDTESEMTTDDPTTDETEPVTEPPVTERDTEPITEPITEPVTEPPVTEKDTEPVTEPDIVGPSITKAEADMSFACKDENGVITISKYTGTAKEVDIPAMIDNKPVTTIAYNAFLNNTSIVSVNIPSTVTEIGESAFYGCTSLKSVSFSSSLTTLGTYAFYNCTSLAAVKLPTTLTNVGSTVFGGTAWMNNYKNDFVIVGDGVLLRYIGKGEDIIAPDTVKHITNAFYYGGSIKSVVLQSGVTDIGIFAFYGCPKLTSITIPDTVTSIDARAIGENPKLSAIYVKSGSYAESWCKNNGFASILKITE